MKSAGVLSSIALLMVLVGWNMEAMAQGTGPGHSSDGIIITRHFTGIWDQVDQEAQGLALQVVEQFDDSRKSVVYWYTYGADRKTAWFVGIGDLVDNQIELELFESTDVGFMQDAIAKLLLFSLLLYYCYDYPIVTTTTTTTTTITISFIIDITIIVTSNRLIT